MKNITTATGYALSLLIAAVLAAGPVFADKPDHAGKGKGQGNKHDRGDNERRGHNDENDERRGNGDDRRGKRADNDDRVRRHFADQHKIAVRDYYGHPPSGRCPPGLAKKHNGCMPPGLAKRWRIGQPLPHDVVYYAVPVVLVTQIGPPPPRHKYVRVAGDILLIAIGTGMVVDAIQDLGRI